MNTTTDEYYEDYYNYAIDSEPCNMNEVKRFGALFLPILYSLVFVFGFLGNVLVVCVLIWFKSLKSMTDVYLLNLALSDLLFVFSLPFWAHYASGQWTFGEGMCKLISWIYVLGFHCSVFFIVLISVDRYLAIVHVVVAQRARTVTYGAIVSCVTWAIAICAALPKLIFSKVQEEYGNKITCNTQYPVDAEKSWKLFYYFEINILGLIIPLIVMVYCYSQIVITLRRCRNYKKHRAIKVIFMVVVVFFVFWTPYNIIVFLNALQELRIIHDCEISKKLDYGIQVTEAIAFCHCCLNPVIYAFAGEKFKKQFYGLLQKCISFIPFCKYCALCDTEAQVSTTSMQSHSANDREISTIL
ncbi:C-C chemokine receptor type 4-like [Latimeria chalumnae]|uniref:C-C chemokine receptor type 4-like n=1 Tax=Latimeria chalumnae TaxID=7897 RepID=UPI0003C138CB|nr:PREDICTED: C-C chemokine receptor type 4-like [Latimeria chalumnae]|eukprot:XP_006003634.1 PREDICTED: C-C chemokine receptor type 4-like [Latimeria chalumnae]